MSDSEDDLMPESEAFMLDGPVNSATDAVRQHLQRLPEKAKVWVVQVFINGAEWATHSVHSTHGKAQAEIDAQVADNAGSITSMDDFTNYNIEEYELDPSAPVK